MSAFGEPGAKPGQLDAPSGLAVDPTGGIYVAEFYNHRVQHFGPQGEPRRVIGRPGRFGAGALHYPIGVAAAPSAGLIVADAYNYQLQWFTPGGEADRRVGRHVLWMWPRPGHGMTGFNVPTGIAVGPKGRLHVADSGNHRVVMLSSVGAFITAWEIPDAKAGVYSPGHVAVSPDGRMVYAADLASNRVIVLRVAG